MQNILTIKPSKTVRNDKLTIFTHIDIGKIVLAGLTVLSHILQSIANTRLTFQTLDFSITIELSPAIANYLTSQGATKKNSMVMHPMRRRDTTLTGSLTVSKLNYEEIVKSQFSTFQRRMFAQTVNKTSNRNIRFFVRLLINLRLKSEGAEITITRAQMPFHINEVSTIKPILLPFFQTRKAMTTRNCYTVILLLVKMTNRDMKYIRELTIMRIND